MCFELSQLVTRRSTTPPTLNVSDFIKNGEVIPVVQWYIDTMIGLGYKVVRDIEVPTQRMKFGANYKLRVPFERILVFKQRRF